METIYEKIQGRIPLNRDEAEAMLEVPLGGQDYYKLLGLANQFAKETYSKGVVFSQVGLDAAPCTINCKFCMLAADNFQEDAAIQTPKADIMHKVTELVRAGTDEIFLMTTAEYPQDLFLEVGRGARALMPADMRLVANVGDFDFNYAKQMKEAGFTGVYHICRLNEGVDTDGVLETRIQTMDAIREAGLTLYYCVEPIGPEHSNQQIVEEIFRAISYDVEVMAVMRRICFEGSPLHHLGEITAQKLALICAVTTLCARPKRAMGVHEPEIISLISGANQIYAENGINPRDTSFQTELSRGMSVYRAKAMLRDAGWGTS